MVGKQRKTKKDEEEEEEAQIEGRAKKSRN